MGIGGALKTRPPFGKFSDPRVTPGPRRFSQILVSCGRVLAYMDNCSTIALESGVDILRPFKV